MSLLATRLARWGRRSGWGAQQAAGLWHEITAADAAVQRLQAASLSAAAGDGGGTSGPRRRRWQQRRASPAAADQAAHAAAEAAAEQPGAPAAAPRSNQLGKLCGRFKSKASGNDAAGAELYFRLYIKEGGEPQRWMLPMLLGTYGRLRQADKAWAVYERLRQLRALQGQQIEGRVDGAAAAAPAAPAPGEQQQQQQQQQQQSQQAQLAAWAAGLVAELRLDALPLDAYAYGALLTALSRASHPPYDLPVEYARKAAGAFRDMLSAGVPPNVVLWHNLMDCQAKACQVDAAFETYRAMRASGAAPTPWTFSILVAACGRARQPQRAADVVDRLMPQAGVAPSIAIWNALLGAHGRAGSVDAAYAAWLQMLDAGAVPDECTERALALAFGSHPALAAEVVAEARHMRRQRGGPAAQQQQAQKQRQQPESQQQQAQQAEQSGGNQSESREAAGEQRPPYRLHHHRQAELAIDGGRQQGAATPAAAAAGAAAAFEAGGGGGGQPASSAAAAAAAAAAEAQALEGDQAAVLELLTLDLHGSSQAAARMVLMRRLETLIAAAPELEAALARGAAAAEQHREEQQQHGPPPWDEQQQQPQQQQLKVITGLGRHSRGDRGGVLKEAVRGLLLQQGLPAQDDPSNAGVLLVPWEGGLDGYLRRQRSWMATDRFFSVARMRYLLLFSGVAGLAAAANLLPRLAPWLPTV